MKKILLLTYLLLTSNYNLAQQGVGNIFISDASNAIDIGIATFKQPSHFSQNDWLTVGAIAGGTALLFIIDMNIKNFALNNQTSLNNNIFNVDTYYGSGYTAIFTTGLMGLDFLQITMKLESLGCILPKLLLFPEWLLEY